MNKFIFSFFILISAFQISFSQKAEKIKGNRNVTIKQTYLDDFSSLIIKNNFEIKLAYNSKTSVEIEADNNLHDVIIFNVNNGVLSISTTRRITSHKKLSITVNYSENLSDIKLYDNAELNSITNLELENLNIRAESNSEANLNIRSKIFKYFGSNKAKARLNIVADSSTFSLNNNSKLNALINGKIVAFEMFEDSNANIEGDANSCIIKLNNSSYFKGKNYSLENADITISENSNTELNIRSLLTLKASGNSKTYIYGKPKIDLQLFADEAKLQKKNQ